MSEQIWNHRGKVTITVDTEDETRVIDLQGLVEIRENDGGAVAIIVKGELFSPVEVLKDKDEEKAAEGDGGW